jgi:hypothetical protein
MYRKSALFALTVFVLCGLYIPLRIPYKLESVGSLLPAAEWKLVQDGAGNLLATQQDYLHGNVKNLASWQFDRGDLAGMDLVAQPDSFGFVQRHDTLIRMYSTAARQRMLELETQIQQIEAQYMELATGSKVPVVEAAQTRLQAAETAFTLREREWQVAERLLPEGLISVLEHTAKQNAYELAKIEIGQARKQLEVVNTGEKVQTLDANNARTAALQKQLAQLRQQYLGFVVKCPFDGVLVPVQMPGEVLVVQQIAPCVLRIPVRTSEMRHLGDSPRIIVTDPITAREYLATLWAKQPKTEVINGQSVSFLIATVAVPKPPERLTLGLGASCSITCDTLNQREYITRLLHFKI